MIRFLSAAAIVVAFTQTAALAADTVSLAGEWAFKLDPDKEGVADKWFDQSLPDKTKLPGSTDENHYGTPNTRPPDYNYLSRLYEYTGPAWYQRDVTIPPAWKDKRVTLFLERCHWETQVWVDGQHAGMRDSLCVPHVYDLSRLLTPGNHRLTICVDNTIKYDVGKDAHSITEQTQTNWNGIIGRIELRATDPVWVEDVQAYPDIDAPAAKIRVTVGNATGKEVAANLGLVSVTHDGAEEASSEHNAITAAPGMSTHDVTISMADCLKLWDEFSPVAYELTTTLTANGGAYADSATHIFGMRKFVAENKRLLLNGRAIFVRGTLECCIFPRTGHPPMTVDEWLRIIRIAKSYGLNHLRFHSWCPPEAAFAAADQEGFLFHVEAPQWVQNAGSIPARDDFIVEELKRILDTYGNHPSFAMMCMGNELGGNAAPAHLQKLVKLGQQRDPRHLYTPSTAWSLGEADDYDVWHAPRGLHGPTTDKDFREIDAKRKQPVISHEIGQWTVYPNLAEIPKYDGVLRARNFEKVRDDLAAKHMLDQAPDFFRASGLLMVLLYKEEIESQLRTPGHAGFQLLDLHDFPGQGTALVGMLDPFWDSKGLITPEEFTRYCGPTVPLLRLAKRTFTTDDTIKAAAEIAHFGPADIANADPVWDIKDEKGNVVASGALAVLKVPTGALTPLGEVEAALANVSAPAKLVISVGLNGTPFINTWEIWVYPSKLDTAPFAGVIVVDDWDSAETALRGGKKVLLLASKGILNKYLPGSFLPVFWSPVWFKGGAGTMSVLCDPKHPAFAQFPTELHTNWQWHDLLQNSVTMILNDTPKDFRPLVQLIDNFSRNDKLGNVFEAKVGDGKLLACSIDLAKDIGQRPVARQMLRSLCAYMASDAFAPATEMDAATLSAMFHPPAALKNLLRQPAKREFAKAVLNVKAGVNVADENTPAAWVRAADKVVARQDGFDYVVHGYTWRDNVGAAWHDSANLEVVVKCPKGFKGTLYAHFHDWNDLNRVADVFFQDRFLVALDNYNGPGQWLAMPVAAEDSTTGKLTLSARPTHENTMITSIVLVKD